MDIKTKRKEAIFDAALLCFNEHGYAETSISIIAQKAGISKGGMYHYFTTKRELFLELFLYKVKQYHSEQLKGYLHKISDPEKRLKVLLNETSHLIQKNEDFYRFCLEFLSMGARDQEIRKTMTDFYKSTVEIFQHMVNEGIDAGKFVPIDARKVARVLYFLVMGTFFTFFSIDVDFDFSDQVSFQTNLVMKAI
jgi:AcrR family transcriptional regulator